MRKVMLMVAAVAFVASLAAAPAMAEDCTGNEKVKVSCKGNKNKAQLKIKVKGAVADSTLAVRFDDDPDTDVAVETNSKGKGKVKTKESTLGEGDHTWALLSGESTCASGDVSC